MVPLALNKIPQRIIGIVDRDRTRRKEGVKRTPTSNNLHGVSGRVKARGDVENDATHA
jgi:hypothetical protein